MRRTLRPAFSALLCASLLAQSVGAADLAPALMRGAMLPPPARLAPPPSQVIKPAPAPKPAGEPWLASARVVAAWAYRRIAESLEPSSEAPSPEALAAYARIARTESVVVSALPAPEPPIDRMLIAMEGRRLLAAGLAAQISSLLPYRSELKPMRPRFTGEWVGEGPVKVRVDYLNPLGMTEGEAKGFRVRLSDGYSRLIPNRGAIPAQLMRELPLYFAGDVVTVEISVRNDGSEPLTGLSLTARQEDFEASGAAGRPSSAAFERALGSLAPGETAVLSWRVRLSSETRSAVNFEQTHVRVLSKDPAGAEKVLLDKNQAGIVDPPQL